MALDNIYQSTGDVSPESGGILLALRDREKIITLFAAREILRPRFTLFTQLQDPMLDFGEMNFKVNFYVYLI